MSLHPFFLLLVTFCAILAPTFSMGKGSAADEPDSPELPSPLLALTEAEQDCLFMIFTKSKLFEEPKVQKAFEQQSCDGSNGTNADIWVSHKKDNDWCELNLEKLNSEFGPMVMHAQGAVASGNGTRLFVKTTAHGIWITIYQPECSHNEESQPEDVVHKTVGRFRRWILQ